MGGGDRGDNRFQSTLPRRERHISHLGHIIIIEFQSTLPRRERLHTDIPPSTSGRFNPRSHEGSDQEILITITAPSGFNPRSHEGSDGISLQKLGEEKTWFQSTLPRRERRGNSRFQCFPVCFNPRSHEGSDGKNKRELEKFSVSIHAPTKGATASLSCYRRMWESFNPRSHEGSDCGS